MANATKNKVGRPAIPVLTQTFKAFSPKGASVRYDEANDEAKKSSPLGSMYLNRVSFAGKVPEGHIPSEVEVTYRILKTVKEPVKAAE